eukprot:GFKZ01001602.1.p1 GENE.GFKZ01001602.1~~GFKZ01001602.1.p1  ORF type:complete len:261 (+),score=33.76 GFKZ01001602.1:282-1064(+)
MTAALRLTLLLIAFIPLAYADCTSRQSYILSLSIRFTPVTQPSLPQKTRVPLLIAVAHRPGFVLFRKTERVNDTVAEVALHRTADTLVARLNRQKEAGEVSDYAIEKELDVEGVTRFDILVNDNSTLISFIAPLVPSPGWFVGLDSFDLCRGDALIPEQFNVEVPNFNSGLTDGRSWTAEFQPFERGDRRPVGDLVNVDDVQLATLGLEQGSLGTDWWKIFLGVLVGVAVIVVFVFFVLPRLRRRKRTDIPLTAPDGVQW